MGDSTSDAAETRLNRLLNLILETAVEVVGFDAATISTRHAGDDLATVGATDQRFVELDDAQYASGEGPCLAVLEAREPLFLEDAGAADARWEQFSQTAAQLGVQSTLSVHVPADVAEIAASLNFYARRRLELDEGRLRVAEGYAEQLAAALQSVEAFRATANLASDMAEAMRTRAVIEQAKGILMADHQITPEEAFERLVALSQRSNTKVRDVARRLVDSRSQPPK